MKRELTIRRSVWADIDELAKEMRDEDRHEIWLLNRSKPRDALELGYLTGYETWTAEEIGGDDPGIVAMGGVTPTGRLIGRTGCIWLLGSHRVRRYPKTLVKHSKKFVDGMLSEGKFDNLSNVVWDGNFRSRRLLKGVGFRVSGTKTTLTGVPYRSFVKDWKDV